jgi:hypothetical protein
MGEQKDSEGIMSTNATRILPNLASIVITIILITIILITIILITIILINSGKPPLQQHHNDTAPTPRSSLIKRMAITFATQSVFLGICLVALNWMHGKYNLKLDIGDVPWWQLFSCFGVANICAQVVLNRAGVEHILKDLVGKGIRILDRC